MVPGALGQERSEQVMLAKTTEFLREMLVEQRRLEALADEQGIPLDNEERLKSNDFGGTNWKATNMEQYEASKQKREKGAGVGAAQSGLNEEDHN